MSQSVENVRFRLILFGVSRFAFVRKPKWILGHAIAIGFVIAAINLGFWQIRRLHQREAYNHQVIANLDAPIASIDQVLPLHATGRDVPAVLDRRVRVTGRYLNDQELVINAQANDDSVPGVWIVTPLALADGRVLLVNRGWLPSTGGIDTPPRSAKAPSGVVTVTGLISETQTKTEGESPERNLAHQTSFLRIDVQRIARQFSQPLVPAFLQRSAQTPADVGTRPPQNLGVAPLSNGPHLSYTIQWFSFAGVVVFGYPFLIWLIARDREEPDRDEPDIDDLPPGAFVDDDGVIDMTGVAKSR